MNEISNWIELHPRLVNGRNAIETLAKCVRSLSAVDWADTNASEEIRKLRRESLAEIDTNAEDERQIARVCLSVVCDLRAQGWDFRVSGGQIEARKPTVSRDSPIEEKARIRAGLQLERDELLRLPSTRQFIEKMERKRLGPKGWSSIYSLMRNGDELANLLREVAKHTECEQRATELQNLIDPYIQVVDDGACEHTGLLLKDIWRYFRYTWANAPKSVPGRNVWLLIRDAAAKHHPVIGIGALGSAIVQLKIRDSWIGWHGDQFVTELMANPTQEWAEWVARSMEDQLGGIYLQDLLDDGVITLTDLVEPTKEVIKRLETDGRNARKDHQRYPKANEHKSTVADETEWELRARSPLFRSKRSRTLAALLMAKLRLQKSGFHHPTHDELRTALRYPAGRAAIRELVRRVKASHVGIDMMDITVCGAIPPYNSLLGGKLVALLMASPEVMEAYQTRYGETASIIASSMAGRAIRRTPRLVLLGTTSLYSIGSSQYNRVRMPATVGSGVPGADIKYVELGRTVGFGSFHFSHDTLAEFARFWSQGHGARLVHSIFGEGVNPRLRKIRDALESVGLDADYILRHNNQRIIYGVPLALNFREILLGQADEAVNILSHENPQVMTKKISMYWRKRWLSRRIENESVLDDVASHSLIYPIQHGARVPSPDDNAERTPFHPALTTYHSEK